MRLSFKSIPLALLLLFCLVTSGRGASIPVKVFFDIDMETDCDDAAALAILHALADRGECEILATVVSVRDPWSVATVDVINTYYGRTNLPLGIVKGAGVLEKSKFAARIATEFPHRITDTNNIPDATLVYQSVTIVTVGYLTNLKNLLQLPARDGHLSGADLIRAKVTKWVCMGGNFIGKPAKDDLKLGNVNFQRDAASALYTIKNWPAAVPLVLVGREIGSVPSGLQIGINLTKTPTNNPVRRAYALYFDGQQRSRHVADPTTVLYAVRGLRNYWEIETKGHMDLHEDMTFEWRSEEGRNQSYLLKKRVDGKSNDRYIESVLDELLLIPPKAPSISGPGHKVLH
jgi:hypothetical protein